MGIESRGSLDLRSSTGEEINDAIAEGIMAVLDLHQREGRGVIAWVNGEVVEVPPDRIEFHSASTVVQTDSHDGREMPPGS